MVLGWTDDQGGAAGGMGVFQASRKPPSIARFSPMM
jgi:hypothetical protein